MSTVTFEISDKETVNSRFLQAMAGIPQGTFITFQNLEQMWKIISPGRWGVLKAMAGKGPLFVREIARMIKKDVHAVHRDVHILLKAGILNKTDTKVEFPYDNILVNFSLLAA